MALFGKKPKKSPEELKKEREEKIATTSNALKLQIVTLEKKRDTVLRKVVEAKQKGLPEQEKQARGLLKQTLAAIKRAQGMLMTLELAIESRDLAQLNMNFLDSIGTLSDDIIRSGEQTSDAKAKRVGDKYMRAVYEAGRQKERIDDMLSMGEFSAAVGEEIDKFSEFDDEIDSMVENAEASSAYNTNPNNRIRH